MNLEPIWTAILFVTGGFYLYVLQQVRRGLNQLSQSSNVRSEKNLSTSLPQVSVVIPCRDEAEHLGDALDDLLRQDYPAERLQVIVVDDRSSDGTADVARRYQERFSQLLILSLPECPEGISPKKHALQRGLARAEGDILITTDGDCRFDPGWISALVSHFQPEVGLVTGLTVFDRGQPEPFWQKLQQWDYLSHSFFAAGAISRGWAFNCNGSNLAMRRAVVETWGNYQGFQQVITGDDTLLLQRLHRQGHWQIRFAAARACLVRSWPEETLRGVLHQRLRWGSGGLSYAPWARAFALSTFVFFLILLISPFLAWLGWISPVWLLLWLLKIGQEARVMVAGCRTFGLASNWLVFGVLELLHVPAILIFSLGGHLWGFRWKGQTFKRTRERAPVYSGGAPS